MSSCEYKLTADRLKRCQLSWPVSVINIWWSAAMLFAHHRRRRRDLYSAASPSRRNGLFTIWCVSVNCAKSNSSIYNSLKLTPHLKSLIELAQSLCHSWATCKNWNVCLKMNTCDISCCGLMYRLISWLINRLNNWLVYSVYLSWYLWSDRDMCALSYRFRPQVLCVWLHNASRCGLWQQHTAWL